MYINNGRSGTKYVYFLIPSLLQGVSRKSFKVAIKKSQWLLLSGSMPAKSKASLDRFPVGLEFGIETDRERQRERDGVGLGGNKKHLEL